MVPSFTGHSLVLRDLSKKNRSVTKIIISSSAYNIHAQSHQTPDSNQFLSKRKEMQAQTVIFLNQISKNISIFLLEAKCLIPQKKKKKLTFKVLYILKLILFPLHPIYNIENSSVFKLIFCIIALQCCTEQHMLLQNSTSVGLYSIIRPIQTAISRCF